MTFLELLYNIGMEGIAAAIQWKTADDVKKNEILLNLKTKILGQLTIKAQLKVNNIPLNIKTNLA